MYRKVEEVTELTKGQAAGAVIVGAAAAAAGDIAMHAGAAALGMSAIALAVVGLIVTAIAHYATPRVVAWFQG